MKELRGWVLVLGLLLIVAWGVQRVTQEVNRLQGTLLPVRTMQGALSTQVAEVLHPTPTVIPDPVTIVHKVQRLARLETVQYTVEKVITAESGQEGVLAPLFGDRLLFVAHGVVIAGVDLGQLEADDLWVEDGVLYVRLPQPEVFVATLDNEKSYVYDRETGLLTKGQVDLETVARQAAEQAILQAALEDGILEQAQANAEVFLERLFAQLGYERVVFVGAEETSP